MKSKRATPGDKLDVTSHQLPLSLSLVLTMKRRLPGNELPLIGTEARGVQEGSKEGCGVWQGGGSGGDAVI